ncbi:periplasmic copper-binding protein [Salinarchaeum sp. Harcht-Bsk1]|uniref:NosD domain-containing protein n=1 Tax=Salinarchaeum sp. Harcht-Bsk1 TaxID=1333523 RepID=UPI000342367C|nr:right-handed parallel beta-helix repeat-containing protein [Salinarchaeum sp. Harcht-Bsk1]AGN01318.1 periplasmic copper-binding protein [Salinarchaeum sp. Harcht-Bsk1]
MTDHADVPTTACNRRTAARLLLGGSLVGLAAGVGSASADSGTGPATLAFHTQSGRRVDYAFEATGDVRPLDHAPHLDVPDDSVSTDRGTTIENGVVTGAIDGGYDVFAYEGHLAAFAIIDGNCAALRLWDSGESVAPCELEDRLPSPHWGTRGDPTVVEGCTTIDEPGYYVLGRDVSTCDREVCIEITADDVLLDGRGHAVEGDFEGVGVRVTGDDAVVRDLAVVEWDVCLQVRGDHALIQGVSLANGDRVFEDEPGDDRTIGLAVEGATGCTVRNVEIYAGREGAKLTSSPDAIVVDSSIEGGGIEATTGDDDRTEAVVLRESPDAILAGTECIGFLFGCLVDGSDRVVLRDSRFQSADFGLSGLRLLDCGDPTLLDNFSSGFQPIDLVDVTDGVLRGNRVRSTERYGIQIERGSNNVLFQNDASDNQEGPGIQLVDTAENVLVGNTIRGNNVLGPGGGLVLIDAVDNVAVRNEICENGGEQILVEGASSGNLFIENDTTCSS